MRCQNINYRSMLLPSDLQVTFYRVALDFSLQNLMTTNKCYIQAYHSENVLCSVHTDNIKSNVKQIRHKIKKMNERSMHNLHIHHSIITVEQRVSLPEPETKALITGARNKSSHSWGHQVVFIPRTIK